MTRTLSDDVHLVGSTLGEVLRAHGSEALFAHVEAMRGYAKTARNSEDQNECAEARAHMADLAHRLLPDMACDVARAFTLYFQLVNLAEDCARVRILRDREKSGGAAQVDGSLAQAIHQLHESGVDREEALQVLQDVELGFVFTAHPTEARRRTTERLLSDVARSLARRDRQDLSPREIRREDRRLRAAIEALWQHASERSEKPTVLEEVKAGLWYLRHVLLDGVPRVMRRLWYAVEDTYGPVDPTTLPANIHFGSWMGSDRDGNPFVNNAITERALELQRSIILDRYREDLRSLADPLAGQQDRVPSSARLDRALADAASKVPEVAREAQERNPEEPLRRMLTFMHARMERTIARTAGAYPNPESLLDDLLAVRDALLQAGASALPNDILLDLIQRVRAFGFHLARMDLREDSEVHRQVVGELLGDPDYPTRTSADRTARLASLTLPSRDDEPSDEARRLLALFSDLSRLHDRFGEEALGTYIISMCSEAADVLEILRLLELHRADRATHVVPLLETPDDLHHAGPLLEELFSNEAYRQHLARRGDVQELLVGYSDSMKRGGILASRVGVLEAMIEAGRVCRAHDIRLRVFHGRGGSVSRGGGPTHRAIAAMPVSAFSGSMKITEQGEMRAHNFANPDLAVRYLEQTLGAAIQTRSRARNFKASETDGERASLLSELAKTSRQSYETLIADPELVTYFQQATPASQIAELHIASRPAKRRGKAAGIDDLRAIPWVFSWGQSRHLMTGWYGVGTALAAMQAEGRLDEVSTRLADSRFLDDLLENVEMALAKSDLPIAERYSALAEDEGLRGRVFGRIAAEHRLTEKLVLTLREQRALLEDEPVLRTSIERRNPYVDPLSYLQVEALKRLRAGEEAWGTVAKVAIIGISAGLRFTG
ncbi:MAG: phosphoenolpyruvate carboxylase [Myxococcota bacterium]